MKAMIVKAVLAAAVAVPLAMVWADDDDDKKTESKKEGKRVEVKVLRLDGKDGESPGVKVLRIEPSDNKEFKVIVGEPADGETIKLFVAGEDDKPGEKVPYLGVAIEPVPAALAAHLPGLVAKDQGLLAAEVAGDSPAAKAGIKEHDILVSYDDQKLFSGEQLTKLVRGDKPGREVTLGIVRAGKAEKVKVTIGDREMPRGLQILGEPGKGRRIELRGDDGRIVVDPLGQHKEAIRILKELEDKKATDRPDSKPAPSAKARAQVRSSFSSMKLESLDGDRFKAELEYKNEKGDSLKRSFEGTRDEIRKEIEADKEMPEAIRNQLLRSLDFGKGAKGAFQFNTPRGGFWIDTDWNDVFSNMPEFKFPDSKQFEQIIEQLSENLDPETMEKLKGAIRSIEPPQKKPAPNDRSL
jgi:hypothetical protein